MFALMVLSLVGPDRPGLVDLLATAVAESEGNWLESRMCRLGGQFAGIVRVEIPQGREEVLRRRLSELEKAGLQVMMRRDDGAGPAGPVRTMILDIVGNDRPGIVRQISHALALRGVNVEELQTERSSAPWTGEPLFEARLRIHLPENCSPADLRRDLEKITSDLMVDFTLGLKS